MKVETWVRVSELFCEAVELPAPERPAFLEKSATDAEVRAEVERLLALHERAGNSLAEPSPFLRPSTPAPRSRIGNYTLLRVLGSGGMGTVYEALQDNPQRTVALKTLRLGFSSPARLQRFQFEAKVLGNLRHPSVAQIYEAGTHEEDGQLFPYFAMELVAGARDLLGYARDENLSREARLALFLEVCDAVHHGHQKGVIHRDLKAGNILVDSEGRAKVIDFGVARATGEREGAGGTQAGQIVGTLATMSPEQLAGDPDQVDVRSDVYSLGVVLYELLAGRPPYDLAGLPLVEALRVVREAPVPYTRELPLELHWIALRALEKDPARRYASALELAADLRRYLAHQPVLAGPPSRLYLARKFVQRNKRVVAALGTIAVVLLAGIVGTSWQATRARAGQRTAETQTEVAGAVAGFLDELLASANPDLARGKELTARELLDLAGKRVEGKFHERPEVEAALRTTIGRSYQGLGHLEESERHFRAALDLYRQTLGPEQERTLEATNHLTWILHDLERYEEAAELGRETLEVCRRVLGEDDARTWAAVNNLAPVLTRLSDFEEAERLLLPALERMRSVGGPDHPEVNDALTNLASNCLEAGRYAEAEAYYRQGLADCRRQQGDDAPETLIVLGDLANVLLYEDRLAEAEPLFEEAVATSQRVLGANHFMTLRRRIYRADLRVSQGRYAEAVEEYRAVIASFRAREDPDSSMLAALNGLAIALNHLGRTEEAAEATRECLELARTQMRAEDLETMIIQENLALYLRDLGELGEALELLEPAQRVIESELGANHPKTLGAKYLLAQLLRDLGESEQARGLYEAVIEVGASVEGPAAQTYVEGARRALATLEGNRARESAE